MRKWILPLYKEKVNRLKIKLPEGKKLRVIFDKQLHGDDCLIKLNVANAETMKQAA